jgi:hypothetical protein
MNSNVLRHRLLGILTKQYIISEKSNDTLGVSFTDIESDLKCTDTFLRQSISELFENKEIGYHDAYDIIGIYATEKGVASFSTKKYWRTDRLIKVNFIKDCIQIIIPVLSLIVAVLAITMKIETVNEATKKSQIEVLQRVEALEKSQNIIQQSPKTLGTDSLNAQ